MSFTWCKRLLLLLALSSACAAQITNPGGRPFASVTGCSTDAAGTITCAKFNATTGFQYNGAAPSGDVLMGNGTGYVDAVPGLPTSRTDATASVTLNCSTNNDRNKIVVLTNAGAIALTGFTPGAGCPDGANIFVDVQGAAAVATLTPAVGNCNGGATCSLTQGLWRIRSDGSQTFSNLEPRSSGSGSGTVNAGTQYQLGYYATSTNAISGTANLVTSAAGQLGVQLGAGVLTDVAMMKFGALAANQNNGNGKPIVAVAHTINDTNFPSIQYVFGYEDDSVASITNGGANNTGYVSYRAAPKGAVAGSVLQNMTAFQDEAYWSTGAPSQMYGFYSQPTNNGTVGSGTRQAIYIWDVLGNKVNNDYGIHISNLANANNNYAYVDDCTGCKSYIANSMSIGGATNSFADTNDKLTVFGHLGLEPLAALAANKPTIATNDCGSTSQGTVSGADSAGIITVGTATVTSCAVTFKTAFANAPSCTANLSVTGITLAVNTTTTKLTITSSGNIDSDKIHYHCINIAAN